MKKFIIPFLAILFLSFSVNAQKVKDKVKNKGGGVIKEKHVGTVTPVVITHPVVVTHPVVHHTVVHHTVVHHPVVHHAVVHHTVVHHPVVHHAVVHHTTVVTPVAVTPVVGKTKTVIKPNKTIVEVNGVKTKETHKHNRVKTKTKNM